MSKHWRLTLKKCDRQMILFWAEKLFVRIVEVNGAFVDASLMCNAFIHRLTIRLPINITHRDPLHLMHEMMSRFRLNSVMKSTSLRSMFRMGLHELHQTEKKYNRYTEFSFHCLCAAVSGCSHPEVSADRKLRQLKQLWSTLVSVTFINDFLLLPELREYNQLNANEVVLIEPIHIILRDAFLSDRTWNETKLMVISHHQHLFFDFPTIMNFARHKSSAFGTTQLMDFINHQNLMDWLQMASHVSQMAYPRPLGLLNHINEYIYRKMNPIPKKILTSDAIPRGARALIRYQ